MAADAPTTVDAYINTFPPEVQEVLGRVRATIRAEAPDALEYMSYNMPSYKLHGGLLSFGGWKKHIAIYPAPEGDEAFNRALAPYRAEKSTVRLPLDQPIPYDLVAQIVRLRVKDNLAQAAAKTAPR